MCKAGLEDFKQEIKTQLSFERSLEAHSRKELKTRGGHI
jgi:hypothetical protein